MAGSGLFRSMAVAEGRGAAEAEAGPLMKGASRLASSACEVTRRLYARDSGAEGELVICSAGTASRKQQRREAQRVSRCDSNRGESKGGGSTSPFESPRAPPCSSAKCASASRFELEHASSACFSFCCLNVLLTDVRLCVR